MKRHLFAILFTLALTGFTVYALLDTFVLGRTYAPAATEMNLERFGVTEVSEASAPVPDSAPEEEAEEAEEAPRFAPVIPEDGAELFRYEDENVSIRITECTRYDTEVYVADVQLSGAEYLKTAFAQDAYGKNVTEPTSAIAAAHGAILAVNGDYYGAREVGYVIRNGVLYRDSAWAGSDTLCVYPDGRMEAVRSEDTDAAALMDAGVWQALCFGPALISDGEIAVTEDQEVGNAMASNPRTAMGCVEPLHYVFVVSDGRTEESRGLSLYELAAVLRELGLTTAYNLDGGGSATMVFQDQVVNKPTNRGKTIEERSVSDIVYVG